jgi:hypothetical protein
MLSYASSVGLYCIHRFLILTYCKRFIFLVSAAACFGSEFWPPSGSLERFRCIQRIWQRIVPKWHNAFE